MYRILLATILLLGLGLPASAQPDREPKDGKMVYAMALSPTGVRKPLSRDYLLPEYRESIQGNKVQMFLRCFMEQDNFFGRVESDKREKWNVLAIDDPELKALTEYGGRLIERDMYDAARMTSAEWQLWYFLRRDSYNTLLPDVQKFRVLASVLKTRVRGEIANRNFDGALHTLKTMFALAKTMESHPTLIGSLVGVAIATIAIGAVDEFIAQPGAPNLFWAATDLPNPMFDLRTSSGGERTFMSHQYEYLTKPKGPMTDKELEPFLADVDEMLKARFLETGLSKGDGPAPPPMPRPPIPSERYAAWAKDAKRVELARTRMIEYGIAPEVVKAMPPLQATVTDDLRRCEVYRDDAFKTMSLPIWQSRPFPAAMDREDFPKTDMVLAPGLIAMTEKIKQAQARIDQRIAYVRIIEAIRLYAHDHGGKLPEKLDDINLPLPIDVFNGKPFEYGVKDGVATLHGTNPFKGTDRLNRYYELTIRK